MVALILSIIASMVKPAILTMVAMSLFASLFDDDDDDDWDLTTVLVVSSTGRCIVATTEAESCEET